MNKIIALVLAIGLGSLAFGKDVKSSIKHVTVYPQGATIQREASTSIEAGQSTLRFFGISHSVNQSSIQLEAMGEYIVQSVSFRYDFLQPLVTNPNIKKLQDSVKWLNEKRGENNATKAAYEEELSFIQSNSNIGNQQISSQADEFDKMAGIIRKRTMEVRLAIHKHNYIEYAYVEDINRINRQIQELQGFSPERTGIIEIKILAEKAISGKFKLSYFVNNASWRPAYDLKFLDIDQPIQLKYNALLRQNTGIEWKDAKLTLSTSTPNMSNTPPTLHPWNLYYQQQVYKSKDYEAGYGGQTSISEAKKESTFDLKAKALTPAEFTTTMETMVSMDFEIDLPYTIESDNKENLINLRKEEIDAEFKYLAVPKLEKEAFLIANVTDWYKLNLLPGTTNLFMGNTFMGQSYLNPGITEDTLQLGFGRDKMVKIERKLVNRSCKKGLIAGKQKHELEYEIVVRNLHKNAIEIEVLDQVPISSIKDIEIELANKSGAIHDPITGMLTWELEIKPGEMVTKSFSFTVKHPRNQTVYPLTF